MTPILVRQVSRIGWVAKRASHAAFLLMSACLLVGLMQLGGLCFTSNAAAQLGFIPKWKKAQTILLVMQGVQ